MTAFERSTVRLAAASVIVAGITLVVFCGQLYVMRKTDHTIERQSEIMQGQLSEMQRSQRPWIGIATALDGPPSAGKDMPITLTMKNSGATPAFNVLACVGVSMRDAIDEREIKTLRESGKDCKESSTIVITPGVESPIEKIIPANLVTPELVSGLLLGKVHVIVYGYVTYTDPAGGKHRTSFCGHRVGLQRTYKACEGGNSAD